MEDRQRQHLEKLRQIHLQQIHALEQQAAKFGLYVPAYITTDIEERRQQVADIEGQLGIDHTPDYTRSKSSSIPTSAVPGATLDVFFSYAHEDEGLRDKLAKHLRNLERQKIITGWHDRRISSGTEWAGQIDTHLNSARIILLLISPDFIDSDYCYDVELQQAMERHQAGEARVIPIILRPVDWKGTPFAKLQALPKDALPVTKWPNEDEAFLNVVQGLRRVIEELQRDP